jgi:hypothetical protein
MTDDKKEPIDLQKRRAEKLLKEEKRRKKTRNDFGKQGWPGAKFLEVGDTIELPDELLDRLKIMIQAIISKLKEAESIHDVERSCFGLALLLLRDIDKKAYDKLFTLIKEKEYTQ